MNLTIYDYVKFAESSYSNDIKKGDNLYGWTVIETNRESVDWVLTQQN